jgi:spore coat protein JC
VIVAEQKARTTYEHLLKLTDDPDVKDPLKFLWAREIIHFQRFGEALVEVETLMKHKKHF